MADKEKPAQGGFIYPQVGRTIYLLFPFGYLTFVTQSDLCQ